MATTGRKRVGQGKAKKASKHKAQDEATETSSTGDGATKEFPQVGDGIRTHRGAASGWASGVVKHVGNNGAIIAELSGLGDVGLENGQYEPGDGFLPANRTMPSSTIGVLPMSHPVIGPPGPVMGANPSGGAGQTLPQGRHLRETQTGGETSTPPKPNAGPSLSAGPAPAEGEQFAASGDAGAPAAHPGPKVEQRMKAEKQARKELDKQTPRPR